MIHFEKSIYRIIKTYRNYCYANLLFYRYIADFRQTIFDINNITFLIRISHENVQDRTIFKDKIKPEKIKQPIWQNQTTPNRHPHTFLINSNKKSLHILAEIIKLNAFRDSE